MDALIGPDGLPATGPAEETALQPGIAARTLARLDAWAVAHARALAIALAVALLPYLIVCNGLAIIMARAFAGGTCVAP